MTTLVKDTPKIMDYLIRTDNPGHPSNMHFLINSINHNKHFKDAILESEVKEIESAYVIGFNIGDTPIEFKLSKVAIDK